ncbi:MAG: hypothetical protein HON90_13810 [Halobacteriovoraceae bacterium]|jgi:tRNA pseudouridine32 synthase / 23S rRNA pseudouridine746 synthase|nr:hypothetical protein [Halobacteriovoraceae bacterium]
MKIQFKQKYSEQSTCYVVDWLAQNIDLSKMKIKKTIDLGGLWITRSNQKKKKRIKKIKTQIMHADKVEFLYDSNLSFVDEQLAIEVTKEKHFGVWYKPASMLSNDTPFSDKGSIAAIIRKKYKGCYLIQRLDREVSGLMLVAYTKNMAAYFSKQLKENKIGKFYQAQLYGPIESNGQIDFKLDGKDALTTYSVVGQTDNMTNVEIQIHTGRFHQIRRHFDMLGFPVMGDPRYGVDNKNKDGIKLVCYRCEFEHPVGGHPKSITAPVGNLLF